MGSSGTGGTRRDSSRDGGEGQSVAASAQDYLRAIGGGLFIGLPTLFTMELWFHGFLLSSRRILLLLAISFLIVVAYSVVRGFRHERSWPQLLVDSLETMGLAVLVAAVALVILGRIDLGTSVRDAFGMIALEGIPIAFGASVATQQLGGKDGSSKQKGHAPRSFARLIAAAGGALLFAINVAPTEEPVLLGAEANWWLLLLVMLATYAVTLAIVFYADFRSDGVPPERRRPLDRPLTATLVAYVLSLGVSLLMLWAFGRTDDVGLRAVVGETLMLGVVASFGAAAGRLLVGARG